jgi:choline dehydrogenase-like flavoprotein
MLDAGLKLEPERQALVEKFQRRRPEEWTASDLASYQAGMNAGVGGVPLKLVYGSDFAYKETEQHLRVSYDNVGLRPSLAQGGLSNVWGAAMMPFLDADIADWPLQPGVLNEHYSAVLRFTRLAACRDSLAESFPLHTSEPMDLRPSGQSQRLLDTMTRNRAQLEEARIHFGRSRLAVLGKSATAEGCVYCRLCMYGCPYDYIYRSTNTLAQFEREPNFTYQPGVLVTSVRESVEEVELSGYERSTRQPLTWRGSRVFLAAGAIATTQLLLRSLAAWDQPVWLKDSQYFLVPFMLFRKVKGAAQERSHGLSQIFVELFEEAGGVRAHVQLYSNSDLVSRAVAGAFGPLRRPLGFLVRDLQERLLVAQGFLHSKNSSRIAVTLKKEPGSGLDRLELRAEVNPATKALVRQVVFKLLKHSRLIGAAPVPPLLKVPEPGRSFHSGGSFPMSATPRGFQTDLLGRPPGWARVHAVDATVFPSVPATTITFSVMANAHRIGWEAAAAGRKMEAER